jgi:hypothetical protein
MRDFGGRRDRMGVWLFGNEKRIVEMRVERDIDGYSWSGWMDL